MVAADAAARRRRTALIAAAALAALAGAWVGSREDGEETGPAAVDSAPTCPDEIASDTGRLVGQGLIVRMEDSATPELLRSARRGEIGGVVLFPSPDVAREALAAEVSALRDAAEAGGAPVPLVMIDQEGGEVKRLAAEPPDRSPAELALGGEEAARAEGVATGRALTGYGVDVDLAPVLDLGAEGSFVAERAFGSEPATVSLLGTAFGEGLQAQGVAATAKHFPGLGQATANSDLEPSIVEGSVAQLKPGIEPFRAAIEAGFGLVMISNSTYAAYDARRPAGLSPRIVTDLLRGELGYDGVVITDDLGAGALAGAGVRESEAAVGASAAGADLLLFALSDASEARSALLRAVRKGELERSGLLASCVRVTALRERFG